MTLRTRSLTKADWDVRMGSSRVVGEEDFRSGLVLESLHQIYGLCTFQHVTWPISRGRDGWAIDCLASCVPDPAGQVIRLESLYGARGRTVDEMVGLVRGVQRLACEHAAEWVVAVVDPMETHEFLTIYECQAALQQGKTSSAISWLFWELGFVDLVLEDGFLAFVWRNPVW